MVTEEYERRGPRPLQFIRVRVYGQEGAEYLRNLLTDDIDRILEDIGTARKNSDAEAEDKLRREMKTALDIRRDVESGLVELVGGPQRERE